MKNKQFLRVSLGEFIGTFLLVFLGCGACVLATLFDVGFGLFHIAMVWGGAVTLAIYATRYLSCAHLNPAVSLAMCFLGRMKWRSFPVYVCAQLLGALIAVGLLINLFNPFIVTYEASHNIIRGDMASVKTAMMFACNYLQPMSAAMAFSAEAVGTFLLVIMVFILTDTCNVGKPNDSMVPLLIGCTLAVLICIFAPLTQASFNPARDFAPRIAVFFSGWGRAAFGFKWSSMLLIYIVGPMVGGAFAALVFKVIILPVMNMRVAQNEM